MNAALSRSHVPFFGTAFALAAMLASSAGIAAQDAGGQQAAQSSEALGVDLYRILATNEGNALFSPYSISMSLALLSAGAEGKTKDELLEALHWGKSPADPAGAFGALARHLDDVTRGEAVLQVANGLWCQQGDAPLAGFLTTAKSDLGAEVRSVDFINSASAAQQEINNWVSLKTSGKIQELIDPGALDASSRLVVVNAVYFKGRWEHPFGARETAPRPFFVGPGKSVPVASMSETERLKLVSVPGCDLVELPYHGKGLSMVILLPKAPENLRSLEQRLTPSQLSEWLSLLNFSNPQNVHVTLPRFKMSCAVGLTPPLMQIGVKSAFAQYKADFSPLNGRHDLYVSAAEHRAFMDVSEEGTEAAATTGIALAAFAVEFSLEFQVDHPFIFLIRDNATGCLLFLGRLVDPRTL